MQLKTVASAQELLEAVDILCIPSSREKMESIHRDVLQLIIPAATLPPHNELFPNKNNVIILYGQWNGKRIRILIGQEGDRIMENNAYTISKKLSIRSKQENLHRIGLWVQHLESPEVVQSVFTGWTAGQYDLGLYKNGDEEQMRKGSDTIISFLPEGLDKVAQDGIIIGLVQQEVMNLVNIPASHKSPAVLGEWAAANAKQNGYHAAIIDKKELQDMGMHALLAVNRGSEHPAHCIVTHYCHPEAAKKIILIGKGVIFDTGGVSIKASKNMHYMKSDMAGAAAALGTVDACARLGLKVDVMAIAPTTDNAIDNTALKPGDVISSYAGKTIEVIDTDAEGRLVLADALAYAVKEYKPDIMIDMATLTGSIVNALGPHAAGLFTKNDQLAESLARAGEMSGERVWRMPMYDEYHEDMQSDIADIKNLSDKPYAGAATAAKFLECFTSHHPAWAHLDIAGMAYQANGFGKSFCATAYGVRLMVKWLKNFN